MQVTRAAAAPDTDHVLTKAVIRTIEHLGISGKEAAGIIGVSEATVSRMRHGEMALTAGSKPFELAVLLVRAFRSLDAITGGDMETSRSWVRSFNSALQAEPLTRLLKAEGLVDVVTYLDARRAPI